MTYRLTPMRPPVVKSAEFREPPGGWLLGHYSVEPTNYGHSSSVDGRPGGVVLGAAP